MVCKKKAQFQFEWIFGIIVGAIILFLAIYAVTRVINTSTEKQSVEFSKEFSSILNPAEAGIASGSATKISLRQETKIYNKCSLSGNSYLGKQDFASSTDLKGDEPELKYSIYNSYVFSKSTEQGKTFYVFSKPFEMPFKTADLIYLTTESFCFISPPEDIADEIIGLDIKNIQISSAFNCSGKKVCFDSSLSGCEISVFGTCSDCGKRYDYGYVIKDGKTLFFSDYSLMYGAIFSSPENYECNVKRLMSKVAWLAGIFKEKAKLMNTRGCDINPDVPELDLLSQSALSLNKSQSLINVYYNSQAVRTKNEQTICKLY